MTVAAVLWFSDLFLHPYPQVLKCFRAGDPGSDPRRSPSGEWQPAQVRAKYAAPSLALPTTILTGCCSVGGALAGPMVATTLRTYAATLFASSRTQWNLGHAHGSGAAFDNRNNQFAIDVGQCNLGAQQIWTAHVAAPQIGSVTTLAANGVKCFSVGNDRRIDRWPLLSRNESADRLLAGLLPQRAFAPNTSTQNRSSPQRMPRRTNDT